MEVEVKFPLSKYDLEAIKASLSKTYTFIKKIVQEDIYFTHPSINFNDRVLRLRKENGKVTLTYKGPRVSYNLKVREELEVEVSEFNEMKEILRRLGFIEVGLIRKIREVYSVNGITVNLDFVEGLGYFIEIEVISDSTNLDLVTNKIKDIALSLGLNLKRALSISYFELLQEKRKKKLS